MLEPRDPWLDRTEEALSASDVAVLLVTRNSAQSEQMRFEWQGALASCLRVVVVLGDLADPAALPREIRHLHAIEHWSVDETVRQIDAELATAILPARSKATKRLAYFERPYAELRRALLGASMEVCFAGNSFDGVFKMLPPMVRSLSQRIEIRLVLPDPDRLSDWFGGRDLELAARGRVAVDLVQENGIDRGSLRLTAEPIAQTVLVVDNDAYIDPLPGTPGRQGLVRVTRGSSSDALYREARGEFEMLFSGAATERFLARPSRESPLPESGSSGVEARLVRAAVRYLESRGFATTTATAASGPLLYDIAMLDRSGRLAVAEVKYSRRPIGPRVVRGLVRAAESVGAEFAFLFVSAELTTSARAEIARVDQLRHLQMEIIELPSERHIHRSAWHR